MGGGVYSSDFEGTGGTFIVSGSLAGDEDYQAYLHNLTVDNRIVIEEFEVNGDTIYNYRLSDNSLPGQGDYFWQCTHFENYDDCLKAACDEYGVSLQEKESWIENQHDKFIESAIDTVKGLAGVLGASVAEQLRMRGEEASFDEDFVKILEADVLEVGVWRLSETDIVVGVGATADWKDRVCDDNTIEYVVADSVVQFGRSSAALAQRYAEVARNSEEYVRLSLMKDGFECLFKTSGYTVEAYTFPEVDGLAGKEGWVPERGNPNVFTKAVSVQRIEGWLEERGLAADLVSNDDNSAFVNVEFKNGAFRVGNLWLNSGKENHQSLLDALGVADVPSTAVRLAVLEKSIKEGNAWLQLPREAFLAQASDQERKESVKALMGANEALGYEYRRMLVPLFDHEDKAVILFDREGIAEVSTSKGVDENMLAYLGKQKAFEGRSPVPFVCETASWFSQYEKNMGNRGYDGILVSVEDVGRDELVEFNEAWEGLVAEDYEVSLSHEKECNAPVNKGAFAGSILAKAGYEIVQNAGCGNTVKHDIRNLDRVPEVGDKAEIKYKEGKGAVVVAQEKGLEKGLGR